jgi:hypothetical protein
VTLDEFIDCLVNDNLRRMARSGETPDEELQTAWEMLYSEYAERSGSTSHVYMFSLIKSISVLRAKLTAVQNTVQSGNIEALSKLGYTGDLKKIIARVKVESVELQGKEKELKKIQESASGEKKASENDFTRWIISVSKFMGYRIDRHKVTIAEFLEMNREWEETIKAKNKQKQKN